MVIVDADSGDFEIEVLEIEASQKLHVRHLDAKLFDVKIGYNFAESFCGMIEKT